MAFGVSFLPSGGQDEDRSGLNGSQQRLQQAIKILSLRLPRSLGAQGGIAPAPLLNAAGGGGMANMSDNPLMAALLPQMMGSQPEAAGPPPMSAPEPMAAPALPLPSFSAPIGGSQTSLPGRSASPFSQPTSSRSISRSRSQASFAPPAPPPPPRIIPGIDSGNTRDEAWKFLANQESAEPEIGSPAWVKMIQNKYQGTPSYFDEGQY